MASAHLVAHVCNSERRRCLAHVIFLECSVQDPQVLRIRARAAGDKYVTQYANQCVTNERVLGGAYTPSLECVVNHAFLPSSFAIIKISKTKYALRPYGEGGALAK